MMIPRRNVSSILRCALALELFAAMPALTVEATGTQTSPSKREEAIPWNQIGAKAGADYHGDGLSVLATEAGARLHCAFQRLDGEATAEGLWLVSTVINPPGDRFQVVATAVGRFGARVSSPAARESVLCNEPGDQAMLSPSGTVLVTNNVVRFLRPGIIEEYSVSMDGVRQDFVVLEKPAGEGRLRLELEVSGAQLESTPLAFSL